MDPWISRELWWGTGVPVPSVSLGLTCFRAESDLGNGPTARLFDAGAPNSLNEDWRAARLTDMVVGTENRSNVEIRPGYMYVVGSFWFREGRLIIPPRGATAQSLS